MRYVMTLATAVALSLATSAMALDADQVRGEIVSVDEETLSLRVQESGDQFAASPGDVNDYRISSDTRVVMEDRMESVLGTQNLTLEDLEPGTEVVLAFEDVDGQLYARDVSMSDSGASADTSGDDPMATEDRTRSETDMAAVERSDDEFGTSAADEEGQRTELPDTATVLPLLAAGGAVFGLMALVFRLVRRRSR